MSTEGLRTRNNSALLLRCAQGWKIHVSQGVHVRGCSLALCWEHWEAAAEALGSPGQNTPICPVPAAPRDWRPLVPRLSRTPFSVALVNAQLQKDRN